MTKFMPQKVSEVEYEVPKGAKEGMKVPVKIYASEQLLQKMLEDRTIEQAVNVAHLPGIQKFSIVLPDGHEGYGFPIGGVAATLYDGGVVSPGGVGYDINCLAGDSHVLTSDGFWIRIRDFEGRSGELVCVDLKSHEVVEAGFSRFLKMFPRSRVFRIITEAGYEVTATGDHPFLTPSGMVPLSELGVSDRVAVYPFEGVEFEEPPEEVIVDEKSFDSLPLSEGERRTVVGELRKRGLLPLHLNDARVACLARLVGYVFGDGTVYFSGGRGYVVFYGRPEDLEYIRVDVGRLGYRASRVRSRTRVHKIVSGGHVKEFVSTEYHFRVSARSFAWLLVLLGAPSGNKARVWFGVPSWVLKSPKWVKRLFLGALFGAELTSPKNVYKYNFYCPVLAIDKVLNEKEDGLEFLRQVSSLLSEFAVETAKVSYRLEGRRKDGKQVVKLRLIVSSRPENLINFFGKVGYVYNRERSRLANLACHYLKLKLKVVGESARAIEVVEELNGRVSPSEVHGMLESPRVNRRFIERTLYEGRKKGPRVAQAFMGFEEFVSDPAYVASDFVWDRIVRKEEVEYYDYVYDFTVDHESHNFVANNFIVSNCGVRLITSPLFESDVRPKLRQLLRELFVQVPSGLGSRGQVRLSAGQLDRVLDEGVDWAVANGYGFAEDREFCEENGSMMLADSGRVSPNAKQRGAPQLGSLGSGNHFLEVGLVNKIYDPSTAKVFGVLEEGQVLLWVHTGSRGLGHQVCSDYLRLMEQASRKYNIVLPDRELASVPVDSPEGGNYLAAMAAAANFAWANRQMITHWVRRAFAKTFGVDERELKLIYDVAHNIAKIEEHDVDGGRMKVVVHRKGATRAFPKGRSEVPSKYRSLGQPVLIPGSMGTSSWILVGNEVAMAKSFGSTAHGAGRMMSRAGALRARSGFEVRRELEGHGIFLEAADIKVVSEEAPEAYKDVDMVALVSDRVGIATRVARIVPIGVVKG
ncbi:MAG: intein-containing RctB family protein [Nitrososphaeria archaeon]